MRPSVAIALCSAFLLASCAGGGGGGGPTPAVPQPAIGNAGGAASSSVAKSYTVVDLGPNVNPTAINNHNAIVGYAGFGGQEYEAFLYSGGALRNLGTLPGDAGSIANDINDSGTIIGTSHGPNFHDTAALFSASSAPQSLGTGNGVSSQGLSVNNAGELVGTVLSSTDSSTPDFCWGQIAIFDGHGNAQQSETRAQAVSVNASGNILFNYLTGVDVGCKGTVASQLYPSNATVPYPANQRIDFDSSAATGLNDLGDVVGYYLDDTNRLTAGFYYHNGTSVEILPAGSSNVVPHAINNDEVIVGGYSPPASGQHAFIWANGTFTDLNSLLAAGCKQWLLEFMTDINAQGYIVGDAYIGDQEHGVLLVPQP